MKTRIKIALPTLATIEDAETAMNELANICNNERKLIARRDAEVLAINAKYGPGLEQCGAEKKERTEALRAFAEANPETFPKGRKSIRLTSGTIGFRTGTPKLALLSRAFTWEKVLDLLKLRWTHLIRVKHEADKETILARYSNKDIDDTQLRAIGLKVVQDETFYAEPDLTELETRQTADAV